MTFYLVERLESYHERKTFSCGIPALDQYLHHQAGQDAKRHVAATFVLVERFNKTTILGFYTLSSTTIEIGELPPALASKLPKYPLIPATLLGRLAVNTTYQGKNLGELLLVDALKRSAKLSDEIASMAVIVDAKNEELISFYQHYGFISFPKKLNKLFLPVATIKKMVE